MTVTTARLLISLVGRRGC